MNVHLPDGGLIRDINRKDLDKLVSMAIGHKLTPAQSNLVFIDALTSRGNPFKPTYNLTNAAKALL